MTTPMLPRPPSPAFLNGGGEMGALMRIKDWTPLAPWAAGEVAADAAHGRAPDAEHRPSDVHLVGAASCPVLQRRLPAVDRPRAPSLRRWARPARECWDEIWHIIGPQIEQVMSGARRDLARERARADHAQRPAARTCTGPTATARSTIRRRPRRRRRHGDLHRDHRARCWAPRRCRTSATSWPNSSPRRPRSWRCSAAPPCLRAGECGLPAAGRPAPRPTAREAGRRGLAARRAARLRGTAGPGVCDRRALHGLRRDLCAAGRGRGPAASAPSTSFISRSRTTRAG